VIVTFPAAAMLVSAQQAIPQAVIVWVSAIQTAAFALIMETARPVAYRESEFRRHFIRTRQNNPEKSTAAIDRLKGAADDEQAGLGLFMIIVKLKTA